MMLPVLSELSELYRAADGAATACLLAKLGVEKSLMAKLEDTRQALLVGGQPAPPVATAATWRQPLSAGGRCCCQHRMTHQQLTSIHPSSNVQRGGADKLS
jgi:hypothetical protein